MSKQYATQKRDPRGITYLDKLIKLFVTKRHEGKSPREAFKSVTTKIDGIVTIDVRELSLKRDVKQEKSFSEQDIQTYFINNIKDGRDFLLHFYLLIYWSNLYQEKHSVFYTILSNLFLHQKKHDKNVKDEEREIYKFEDINVFRREYLLEIKDNLIGLLEKIIGETFIFNEREFLVSEHFAQTTPKTYKFIYKYMEALLKSAPNKLLIEYYPKEIEEDIIYYNENSEAIGALEFIFEEIQILSCKEVSKDIIEKANINAITRQKEKLIELFKTIIETKLYYENDMITLSKKIAPYLPIYSDLFMLCMKEIIINIADYQYEDILKISKLLKLTEKTKELKLLIHAALFLSDSERFINIYKLFLKREFSIENDFILASHTKWLDSAKNLEGIISKLINGEKEAAVTLFQNNAKDLRSAIDYFKQNIFNNTLIGILTQLHCLDLNAIYGHLYQHIKGAEFDQIDFKHEDNKLAEDLLVILSLPQFEYYIQCKSTDDLKVYLYRRTYLTVLLDKECFFDLFKYNNGKNVELCMEIFDLLSPKISTHKSIWIASKICGTYPELWKRMIVKTESEENKGYLLAVQYSLETIKKMLEKGIEPKFENFTNDIRFIVEQEGKFVERTFVQAAEKLEM